MAFPEHTPSEGARGAGNELASAFVQEAQMKLSLVAALALGAAMTASTANAAVVFSGSRSNVDAPGIAEARCGSLATTSVRNAPPTATSIGTSNFGAFTPTLSHCIQLPLAIGVPTSFTLGQFLFAFASGDSLFGTYDGTLTPLTPGQFSVFQSHIVTGGTGAFAGASGTFDSSGTLSFLTGRPTVSQTFQGLLVLPAVPEPTTWLMMLSGFGMIGWKIRRKNVKQPLQTA